MSIVVVRPLVIVAKHLGFLGLGLLKTGEQQESSKLKTLGAMTLLSSLGLAIFKAMKPSSLEEKLKSDINKLIDEFPDFNTVDESEDNFRNEIDRIISSVMEESPIGAQNNTNY